MANGANGAKAPQWVVWGTSATITMLGAVLTAYSVVERIDLPIPMYPLLGLMMGVLPANVGNQLLKRLGGD